MLIGAGAWAIRFGLSALGYPFWLMIATLALHGFAFGFFFVVAQMYVDRAASKDIKASAQSLLIFLVYGVGTVIGGILTGYVREQFTITGPAGTPVEDWRAIWMGPFLLTLFCMLIFAILFKEEQIGEIREETEQEPEVAPALH
jgi:MFS family permease